MGNAPTQVKRVARPALPVTLDSDGLEVVEEEEEEEDEGEEELEMAQEEEELQDSARSLEEEDVGEEEVPLSDNRLAQEDGENGTPVKSKRTAMVRVIFIEFSLCAACDVTCLGTSRLTKTWILEDVYRMRQKLFVFANTLEIISELSVIPQPCCGNKENC